MHFFQIDKIKGFEHLYVFVNYFIYKQLILTHYLSFYV